MSHYTEGVLQAYLDDEVTAESRAAVAAHVADCRACAARLHELADLGQTFRAALSLADVQPIPAAALAELRMQAQATAPSAWLRIGSPRVLLRAATLVLGITAVGAATVPGSPLNTWLKGVWQELTADTPAIPTAPQPAPVPAPAAAPGAIYVPPVQGRIRIALSDVANGTTVEAHLVDSDRAMVECVNKGYRSSPGRAEILGCSGHVKILIPRTANDAAVEVDGELYVSRVGNELKLVSPNAEKVTGPELIFKPTR